MYVSEYLQDAITEYTVDAKRDYLDPEDLPFDEKIGLQSYKQAGIAYDIQAVFAMKQVSYSIHTYTYSTYIHTRYCTSIQYIHLTFHTYIHTYIHIQQLGYIHNSCFHTYIHTHIHILYIRT